MSSIELEFRREMVRQRAPRWLEPSAPWSTQEVIASAVDDKVNEFSELGIDPSKFTISAEVVRVEGDVYHVTYHFTPKGLSSDGGIHGSKPGFVIIDDLESDE